MPELSETTEKENPEKSPHMWKKRTCFSPSSLELCLKEMVRARPGENLSNRFTWHTPFGEDAEGMSSEKEVGGRKTKIVPA